MQFIKKNKMKNLFVIIILILLSLKLNAQLKIPYAPIGKNDLNTLKEKIKNDLLYPNSFKIVKFQKSNLLVSELKTALQLKKLGYKNLLVYRKKMLETDSLDYYLSMVNIIQILYNIPKDKKFSDMERDTSVYNFYINKLKYNHQAYEYNYSVMGKLGNTIIKENLCILNINTNKKNNPKEVILFISEEDLLVLLK